MKRPLFPQLCPYNPSTFVLFFSSFHSTCKHSHMRLSSYELWASSGFFKKYIIIIIIHCVMSHWHPSKAPVFTSYLTVSRSEKCSIVVVVAAADVHKTHTHDTIMFPQPLTRVVGLTPSAGLSCEDRATFSLQIRESLFMSHWGYVPAGGGPPQPCVVGSDCDLSDASLGWGEMILIVALPQPSPQLCLNLHTQTHLRL